MASGYAKKDHNPAQFLKNAGIVAFIGVLELESENNLPIKTVKGRGITGTYATELVALRYAGWISPKVEVEVYRTFQKVANADEGLTHDLLDRQSNPDAAKRLAARAQSKVARLDFTDTLQDHGVKGVGFALCTNAIYEPLFGANAKQLKQHKNLSEKQNLREGMSIEELTSVMFAEVVASKRIKEAKSNGDKECEMQARKAAQETRLVLENK